MKNKQESGNVEFEILTEVVMRSYIYWDITPCSPLTVSRSLGGIFHLHLHAGFLLSFFSIHWRCRRHIPPKSRLTFNGLHDLYPRWYNNFRNWEDLCHVISCICCRFQVRFWAASSWTSTVSLLSWKCTMKYYTEIEASVLYPLNYLKATNVLWLDCIQIAYFRHAG
jgi:hypothetical protein